MKDRSGSSPGIPLQRNIIADSARTHPSVNGENRPHIVIPLEKASVCFVFAALRHSKAEGRLTAWEDHCLPPATCGLPGSSECPPEGGVSSYLWGGMLQAAGTS